MIKEFRKNMPWVAFLGILLCYAAVSYGWNNQQGYVNNTGVTAYDLTKIIDGTQDITDAIHDKFNNHSVDYVAGLTVLHFYNGEVAPGEFTWACFNSASGEELEVIAVFWTNADGSKIGNAGPAYKTYPNAVFTDPNAVSTDTIEIQVTNSQRQWSGPGYPVLGDYRGPYVGLVNGQNVNWAVVPVEYPMEELNENLYTVTGITWYPLANFNLYGGQTTSYTLHPVAMDQVVLFRFESYGIGRSGSEIIQIPVVNLLPPAAPSNLSAAARSGTRIDLNWQDNAANETGFQIQRSTIDGGPYATIDTIGVNETCYSDTTCQNGQTYYYVVCAYNLRGNACSGQAGAQAAGGIPQGRWVARDNHLMPQNSNLLREVIPGEDMDNHNVTWSANNVRFFPSWNWSNPRPGDQLCWLYDSPAQNIWWKSTFFRASRSIYVQLNGCDNNDGWVDIFVDNVLEYSYDSYHAQSSPVLICGSGFNNVAHTVQLQTRRGGCPHVGDVSIDYIAIPRLGWDVQEHFTNHTGQIAYDLTKILPGSWLITEAIHDKFQSHTVLNFGAYTIIHWFNGQVASGAQTAACFNVMGPFNPPVAAVFWTNQYGQIIGQAGAPVYISGRLNLAGNLIVDVNNSWREWTGTMYPPEAGDGIGNPVGPIDAQVYYAVAADRYELEEMDPCFVAQTDWTEVDPALTLAEEETRTYDLGQFNLEDVIVLRVDTLGNDLPGREMAQIRIADLIEEPAGDLNGDGCVNLADFSQLAMNWLVGCQP